MLMVLLVPGALAFVFGWFAFRSRVTGVYLSIITQALTFALMLAFFRNNFGFGGNNGLTDFKDILGFNVQAQGTRAALFAISALALMVGIPHLPRHRHVEARQGPDRDPRRRNPHALPRLSRRILQAVRLYAVGLHGRRRRRAVCAAGRHHQSERVFAGELDRGGDLGRGRRPRHADRRRDWGRRRELPFARARFGEAASPLSRAALHRSVACGTISWLDWEGRPVAAGLSERCGTVLHSIATGTSLGLATAREAHVLVGGQGRQQQLGDGYGLRVDRPRRMHAVAHRRGSSE